MKIYFDNLNPLEANCSSLSESPTNKFWLVPGGTRFKKVLEEMQLPFTTLDNYSNPGCYVLEVNGDPFWWNGVSTVGNVPRTHVLSLIPSKLIKLARDKKLRIVIAGDREGGWMAGDTFDCFQTTSDVMKTLGLPARSILIMQGNKKIEDQYKVWLEKTNHEQMFDVMYSNHFGRIFWDDQLPSTPLIEQVSADAKSFNSLNRVHRTHRAAHLYTLASCGLLEDGLVSGNQLNPLDHLAAQLAGVSVQEYASVMRDYYPRYVDGNWAVDNAANQYTASIYTNSLMSFITETKFSEDVAFLTEKVFKPISLGHPMIVLASAGTLQGLRELGFKTDWCGIDPSYNDIASDKERFDATHKVLTEWIQLSQEEKLKKISQSRNTIEHNFNLIRSRDFYKEAIVEMLKKCEEYLND